MSQKSITIRTKSVKLLLRFVQEGRFAVPKLQREFVWDGPKAAKLLDSIYAMMPIGVVMVWETSKTKQLYLRKQYHVLPHFDSRNSKVWFLIDGQQRVSVLHHVREGSNLKNASGKDIAFSRVVFALEPEEDDQRIRYRKPIQDQYVSLKDVLHPQWRSRLKNLGRRHLNRVKDCRMKILHYPMHLMFVKARIDEIREVFIRVNTQGMKISTADAIITRAETLRLRDFVHEVRPHVDDGFGMIPEQPILFAMVAIHGATESRGKSLDQAILRLQKEVQADPKRKLKVLERKWTKLSSCFGKSVDYLRENFAVLNHDYLYSDYLIAVLALFFFHKKGRGITSNQRKQLNRWFWATCVGGRYSGNSVHRNLPTDVEFCERLAKKPNAKSPDYNPNVNRYDVRRAQYGARTGITTAFYCMLLQNGPVSIRDDGLQDIPRDRYAARANRKDRHHIFPRAALAPMGVDHNSYNSICNICLLTAEENQSIGSRRPRKYLTDLETTTTYFKKKMKRHLIPVGKDSGVWNRDIKRGYRNFVRQREKMICDALEKQAGLKLFRSDP